MMKLLKAKLSGALERKLRKKKVDDGYADAPWEEWFAYLVEDVKLHDTSSEIISKTTRLKLEPLWMNNFAENLPFIRKGKSIKELVATEKDKAAIIVGAGPSVYLNKHLDTLAKSKFPGVIVATDRMLIPLLKKGIVPHYTLSCDGNEKYIVAFYKHKLVKKHANNINVILNIYVSPTVTKRLKKLGVKTYWYASTSSRELLLLTKSKNVPNGVLAMRSGGNTGTASWVLSWAILKCNPTCLIGFDFGYPEGAAPLEETSGYYSAALQIIEQDKTASSLLVAPKYETVYHPIFKTKAQIDPVFSHYRQFLVQAVKEDLPPEITLYNCTEGGTLFGTRINCMTLRKFLKKVQ